MRWRIQGIQLSMQNDFYFNFSCEVTFITSLPLSRCDFPRENRVNLALRGKCAPRGSNAISVCLEHFTVNGEDMAASSNRTVIVTYKEMSRCMRSHFGLHVCYDAHISQNVERMLQYWILKCQCFKNVPILILLHWLLILLQRWNNIE